MFTIELTIIEYRIWRNRNFILKKNLFDPKWVFLVTVNFGLARLLFKDQRRRAWSRNRLLDVCEWDRSSKKRTVCSKYTLSLMKTCGLQWKSKPEKDILL